jgi:uncharacterized protein (TIGR01777 family)
VSETASPSGSPGSVLITGGTGLIGRALVAALARDGVPVTALVRDPARAAPLLPGATLHKWDGTQGPPPESVFAGVDLVINLMGEPVDGGRWSEARKRVLRDSRVVATRALVDAMRGLARRPRVLISASGTGYYGARGDEILTEASPVGAGFVAELARDWEAEGARASELGLRVVLLRTGLVLARGGGILAKLLMLFRLGLGGRVGDGKQWLPWIHLDDEIGFIRHAMTHDTVTGAFNAVAPEPATNAEFGAALGRALGRPSVMRAPAFALRLVLGEMADELLLASQRAMPVRTLGSGYVFRHPLLAPALRDLL